MTTNGKAHMSGDPVAVSPDTPRDPQGAKLVRELMSEDPETVCEGTPLAEAAVRMADRRIGCLPVRGG